MLTTSTVTAESIEQEVELCHAEQHVAYFFCCCVPQQNYVVGVNQHPPRRALQGVLQVDFYGNRVAAWQFTNQDDL
ncbi:MAG: hypothetical protein P8J37_24675 [Fuerstiella sp.]|nr:hypothetical protein [Fuerstiella sp.]